MLQTSSITPIAASGLTLKQQVLNMESKISNVESKVSTGEVGMEVLSNTMPENWEKELVFLRGKDNQLREELHQLHEMLLRKPDA